MARVIRLLPLIAFSGVLAGCGAGTISGTVSISPGVPPPTVKTCVADSFTFSGSATGLLSGGGKTFIGTLHVTATGSTPCDLASGGKGTLTAVASGSSGGTSVSCPSLPGTFNRIATNVSVSVSGTCTVTDKKGTVTILQKLTVTSSQFIPTKTGAGGAVTGATFVGEFAG
jgi:hypothetical protein